MKRGKLRTWANLLRNLLAAFAALFLLVTLAPPNWYARMLAGDWNDPQGATLIVLGGDAIEPRMIGLASYWRTVYASMAWRDGHFRYILLSGEPQITEPMRDLLISTGVPREAIVIEGRSTSTHENALFTAQLAPQYPGPYVLLTSDYHMLRAHRAFTKAGLTVQPRPFPEALKRMYTWRLRWNAFLDLAEESAKICYYWARGWI